MDESSRPQPLPARAAAPPELEQLVLACLAKDPRSRPARAADVASRLRAMVADGAPAVTTAAPAVALRPPPAAEPAIDANWSRSTSSGPTPQQLRSQGFRRGLVVASFAFLALAAAFVFFVLPERVERAAGPAAPEPAAAPPAATPQEPAPDLQGLAQAKQGFEALRPDVGSRLDALEQRAAGDWGGEPFARGKRALAEADAAFVRRSYTQALERLRAADADLSSVAQQAGAQSRAALSAGAPALDEVPDRNHFVPDLVGCQSDGLGCFAAPA